MEKQDKNSHLFSDLVSENRETPSPKDAEPEAPSESLQEVKQALTLKSDEVRLLQDKHLRLAAEFENYKRLAQRDQREFARFANENILKELLPIVDNLERAIRSAKESAGRDGLVQGIELTLKQFQETLKKFGVRAVPTVGTIFDPACHQAVARTESATDPENTVIMEHQKGYLLHDRMLRPAMVTVAAGPPAASHGQAPAERSEETPTAAPDQLRKETTHG